MEGSGKPCQKMSGACQQFFWFVIRLIRFCSASPSWVWMEKWNSFIQHWKLYGRFEYVCLCLWINKNGFWKMPDLFQMVWHNTSLCHFSPASEITTQCGTVRGVPWDMYNNKSFFTAIFCLALTCCWDICELLQQTITSHLNINSFVKMFKQIRWLIYWATIMSNYPQKLDFVIFG